MAEVVTEVQVLALVVSADEAKEMEMVQENSGSPCLSCKSWMGRCCTCPPDLCNLRRLPCLPIYYMIGSLLDNLTVLC